MQDTHKLKILRLIDLTILNFGFDTIKSYRSFIAICIVHTDEKQSHHQSIQLIPMNTIHMHIHKVNSPFEAKVVYDMRGKKIKKNQTRALAYHGE